MGGEELPSKTSISTFWPRLPSLLLVPTHGNKDPLSLVLLFPALLASWLKPANGLPMLPLPCAIDLRVCGKISQVHIRRLKRRKRWCIKIPGCSVADPNVVWEGLPLPPLPPLWVAAGRAPPIINAGVGSWPIGFLMIVVDLELVKKCKDFLDVWLKLF